MPEAEIIPFEPPRRPRRTPRRSRTTAAPRGLGFTQAMESWELALNSRGKAAGTIRSYRDAVRNFTNWLGQEGCICRHPDPVEPCPVKPHGRTTRDIPTVEMITAEDVRIYLTHERRRTSPGNAHKVFRNLRALFNWLIDEGDLEGPSPVRNADAPDVPERELPPLSDEEIAKLLKTCKSGGSHDDLRDYAIMRLLLDIGPRVAGLAGIRYAPDDPKANDVHLAQYEIRIRLKGGDDYLAPIGKQAAAAIDRYIRRARMEHPDAESTALWLGKFGPLGVSGVQALLRRRGDQAGVVGVTPHRFRRTAATNCVDSDQSETDVMHNFGWKRPEMVRHYTKATAKTRARRNHQRSSPADRY
ncbi:tyrosine-type recombinase/integrase [Actinomadura rudentiformis]|nr:tyrosine-type recombinase/integrase [Actinomadura rudentiformis]